MKRFILVGIVVLFFGNLCIGQGNADSTKKEKRHSFAITGGVGKAKVKRPDTTKRFTFGINDGYGIPIGPFRKADISKYPNSRYNSGDTSHLGGYAKYGFHYEFYAALRLFHNFSIMASVGGSNLGYDITSLNSQFITYFKPNTVSVTLGDSYYVLQYMLGANYNIPTGKHFSLECRAMAGFANSNYPPLSYINIGAQDESEIYTFPEGSGFAYCGGVGLKFITAEGHIGVHVNMTYSGSDIKFTSYSVAYYTQPNPSNPNLSNNYIDSGTVNETKILSVNLLQFTFGITGEL